MRIAPRPPDVDAQELPAFVTANELAETLRTSRKAVYLMAARGQVPGVFKLGRRLLFRRDEVLSWLRAPPPQEKRR